MSDELLELSYRRLPNVEIHFKKGIPIRGLPKKEFVRSDQDGVYLRRDDKSLYFIPYTNIDYMILKDK